MNYHKLAEQAAELEKIAKQLKKTAAKLAKIEAKYDRGQKLTAAEYEMANFTGDQQMRYICNQLQSHIPVIF
jgi:hypothetical protein